MSFTTFINKHQQSEYFYRVSEFLNVIGTDKSFSHNEDFRGVDLPRVKKTAIAYLNERQQGIEERGHFYNRNLVPPDANIKAGQQSTYSINLVLVIKTGSNEEENILYGEDTETIEESKEIESLIYNQLGFSYE